MPSSSRCPSGFWVVHKVNDSFPAQLLQCQGQILWILCEGHSCLLYEELKFISASIYLIPVAGFFSLVGSQDKEPPQNNKAKSNVSRQVSQREKKKKSLVITLVYLFSVYLCFPTLSSDYFLDDLCIMHFLSLETKYHDDMCRFHLITGLINM